MLFIINNVPFPDKQAGYNGGKPISKQASMKATNSGAN